jgi:hypothetical protein
MEQAIYDKPSNEWWDGYDGEPVVLVDDPKIVWAGNFWDILKASRCRVNVKTVLSTLFLTPARRC